MVKGFYSGVLVPVVTQYKFATAWQLEIVGAIFGWIACWGITSKSLAIGIVSTGGTIIWFYCYGLVWDHKTYFRKSNRAAWLIGFIATFSSGTDLYLQWNFAATAAVTMFIAISVMWLGVQHSK